MRREHDISQLAQFIYENYYEDGELNLLNIVRDNEITYSIGDYENYFDGMLECKNKRFHIYLNSNPKRRNLPTSNRGRFTLAHELGHFYLDEHRNALLSGVSPHALLQNPNSELLIEKEANYFASCLLMPERQFRHMCMGRKFSPSLIQELSDKYHVSPQAVLLRYYYLDLYPIFFVFIKDNIVTSIFKSKDFKPFFFKDIKGKIPPENSLAWCYIKNKSKIIKEPILSEPSTWFIVNSDFEYNKYTTDLFEYCFSWPSYNTYISILWRE